MKNDIISIAGVKVHWISMEDAVKQIEEFIAGDGKHQVCATNVYSVVVMQKDREFKEANNASSLVVADGMPLVWIAPLYDKRVLKRIAGYDLFCEMCKEACVKGYTFYLMGSRDDVLMDMCKNLKLTYPELKIAGTYAPPYKRQFSDEDNAEITRRINEVKPDILWVGMTAPKQEKWIYKNLEAMDIKVAIGVGAVFDFVAKRVKRAPLWMRRNGLEWAWRFLMEPRRLWRRYLIGNPVFTWLVLREMIIRMLTKRRR